MEMHTLPNGASDFDNLKCSLLEALVAETAILADKSLLVLLFLVWLSTHEYNVLPNSMRTDQRFPTSGLIKVKEPDAETNDAGEAVDDKDNDDDEEYEDNDEDDGNDSEEDSDDDEEDSDDELEAAGYGESDDDDDDDDDDDEDDDSDEDDESDEDDDDDDSEDEDDEEQFKLPSQRKK